MFEHLNNRSFLYVGQVALGVRVSYLLQHLIFEMFWGNDAREVMPEHNAVLSLAKKGEDEGLKVLRILGLAIILKKEGR